MLILAEISLMKYFRISYPKIVIDMFQSKVSINFTFLLSAVRSIYILDENFNDVKSIPMIF